jgi:hypothetical protein
LLPPVYPDLPPERRLYALVLRLIKERFFLTRYARPKKTSILMVETKYLRTRWHEVSRLETAELRDAEFDRLKAALISSNHIVNRGRQIKVDDGWDFSGTPDPDSHFEYK